MLAPFRGKHVRGSVRTLRRVGVLFVTGLGSIALRGGTGLVVGRGRCGFLSLRDPTTWWSGHPGGVHRL